MPVSNNHMPQRETIKSDVEAFNINTQRAQQSKLSELSKNVTSVSHTKECLITVFQPEETERQDQQSERLCNYRCSKPCHYLLRSSADNDTVDQKRELSGRQLYAETEQLLNARRAEIEIRQPAFKLKGWLGWLLGAGTLIGIGATSAYFYGQSHSRSCDQNKNTPCNNAGYGNQGIAHTEDEVLAVKAYAPQSAKLQNEQTASPPLDQSQERVCASGEDLESCKDAYRFRQEAGLAPSQKLTIKTGATRCVCPSENAVVNTAMQRSNRKNAIILPQLPACSYEENFKACEDAYRFRKKAGLDPSTRLTLNIGGGNCVCPPENSDISATTTKMLTGPDDKIINLGDLTSYDGIENKKNVPEAIRKFITSKQLKREIYNRYFYPLLLSAGENILKVKSVITEADLIKELFKVLSLTLKKFEVISLIHALRLDLLYNQLVYFSREIGRIHGEDLTYASNIRQVIASPLNRKLHELFRDNEFEELQAECIELTKTYSASENLHVSTYISGKLKNIIEHIMLIFEQTDRELVAEKDNYISDYLSIVLFNLDRDLCNKLITTVHNPLTCSLYPSLGVSLFKNKQEKFRQATAVIIAGSVFIPRLKEIYLASHLYIENKEYKFIEKVICSFTDSNGSLFCQTGTLDRTEKIDDSVLFGHTQTTSAPLTSLNKNLTHSVSLSALSAVSGAGFKALAGAGAATIAGSSAGVINILDKSNFSAINIKSNENINGHLRAEPEINNNPDSAVNQPEKVNVNTSADNEKNNLGLSLFSQPPAPPAEDHNPLLLYENFAKSEFKGKDYIIVRGIYNSINEDIPEYIRQTQVILRSHLNYTSEMISNLHRRLSTSGSDIAYMNYLQNYFRGALRTDNEKIINQAIVRFKEIVERVHIFFNNSLRQGYKNIYIISTRQRATVFEGEFTSLLTEEELRSVPNAISFYSRNPTMAIVTDTSYIVNPEHVEFYRRIATHDLTDTLVHEATHLAFKSKDHFTLPRTATGRSTNALDAYNNIRVSLENMGVEADLQAAILSFTQLKGLPYPQNVMDFLTEQPDFLSSIIMESADHLEIFIRDIARGVNYDAPAPL